MWITSGFQKNIFINCLFKKKIPYLVLLLLESETFVKNPGGVYRNGRLRKKGKKKMKVLGKVE